MHTIQVNKRNNLLYNSIKDTMKWQYFFKPQICNIFVHCAEGLYLVQNKMNFSLI